jgi:DNA-binding response OmpR family regulator
MPHIVALAVGRDPLLLETRSQVLRSAGYTVVSELSLEQSLQHFRNRDFDIVILCHSIPVRDRELLTSALHNHSPRTPVIVVSSRSSALDRFADATVENDPSMLLEDLARLLCKPPQTYQREGRQA